MGKKYITLQDSFSSSMTESNLISFDIQSDNGKTLPLMHKHSRFLYILEGEGKIKIQDKVYKMAPGAVISILPWQTSEIIEVEKNISYYLLVYNFNLINIYTKSQLNLNKEEVDFIKCLYSSESALYDLEACDKIEEIFEDIRKEVGVHSLNLIIHIKKKFSTIYLMCKISELLIIYMRYINDDDTFGESVAARPENIFMYMFLNSSKDISLEVLSKIFLMSESAISQYIKDVTGLGFLDILHEIRIYKAKFLLSHTDMTLKEIAKAVHYSDPAQLSKVFQSKQAISTKDFRRLNQIIEGKESFTFKPEDLKLIDFVNENYAEDIDIMEVSKKFDITPRNINKIFVYFMEQNFYSYLHQVRVHAACDLLVNTDEPITDIAIGVGYNSPKTLLRNFLKHVGMTPSEFRSGHLADLPK
ncbi:AraC family transcriptional regulator [Anaerococcus degeneri]|uniref:Helix-turn-helix domain-containing protein n=1 Tax=Anaerococcus degeneri TaxID=361500 RepID=A0ABS7YYI9_9FIRM|nr:helix-turn-helix domain-containing protein [Anaerococcus degeneri]MBP2015288.1 AraC-like DNA-binding protein [Anaerococcus degeneri]MCA2096184.1 helix-turn-helix domain-containing protein [Anaerococcus degeneri]